METDWEDDWENAEIPDLLLSVINKADQVKFWEERKLMEEDGNALVEELFDNEKANKRRDDNLKEQVLIVESIKMIKNVKKEKPEEVKLLQEKKQKELQEKQKEQSKHLKAKKQLAKRIRETFGEAELDEYEEMYGNLEDKY